MKHGIKGRKLNRTSPHRKALLQNLASSLIKHQRIKTTLPKAKELRPYIEKIITAAKDNTVHSQRLAARSIKDKALLKSLFENIAPIFRSRNGGYTRIMKNGFRTGDKAPMAVIEFVEKSIITDPVQVTDSNKDKKKALNKSATDKCENKVQKKEAKS